MSGNFTFRSEEIDQIFGGVLPWIESALEHQYALPREDTTGIEHRLYEWFHGFVRRPGSPRTGERLRPHLILMTCQAGHVYWAGKLGEAVPVDENVRRSLSLGPAQIAIELGKAIEKESEEKDNGGGDGQKGH